MEPIQQWWAGVPPVTKYLFAGCGVLTLAGNFGLINPRLLLLDFNSVFGQFQIWRLVSSFFFLGGLGFPFLINMMMIYQYSRNLEMGSFHGRTADYVFMLLFGGSILLAFGLFMGYPIVGIGLILMLIYVWSRKNPNENMTFMFGLRFKSAYLPWVLIGFSLLMGGNPVLELAGVIVGHIYFYLEDIYPLTGGRRFLQTPQFLKLLFQQPDVVYGTAPRAAQQAAAGRGGHQWGQGRPLH
eukprot:TRINITY_DN4615_c0_g1_i1.p1 TRINITY_DN4615_c0_g1~~TRINITY_DN4615_c0_g1_i1.p1  ORF type:complete len:256 (-),score=28.80 TRINITY_DN4615_c0_g1_i1:87-806(-)